MSEIDEDAVNISFQWIVGDFRALEEELVDPASAQKEYAIMFFSRVAALGLIFFVAYLLLPNVDTTTILLIALAGSLSIWVSLGLTIVSFRAFERMTAVDPEKVGWNSVWLDATGITWDTEVSHRYTSWFGISQVVERDGSLWLKTGPAHGYYLPSRVFASPDELRKCKNLVEQFRENPRPPKHLSDSDEDVVKH